MAKIQMINEDGDYWEGEEPNSSCFSCLVVIGFILLIIYGCVNEISKLIRQTNEKQNIYTSTTSNNTDNS